MTKKLLQDFEGEVLYNVMMGVAVPKVTDDQGDTPIVACLDSECLGDLFAKIRLCGGYATVYSLADSGEVRVFAAISDKCSIHTKSTDMTSECPSADASVGAFIDFLVTQGDGVLVPDILPSTRVKSCGRSELVSV